jgi:hypothetical protein
VAILIESQLAAFIKFEFTYPSKAAELATEKLGSNSKLNTKPF